jgi:hypothetical protein
MTDVLESPEVVVGQPQVGVRILSAEAARVACVVANTFGTLQVGECNANGVSASNAGRLTDQPQRALLLEQILRESDTLYGGMLRRLA